MTTEEYRSLMIDISKLGKRIRDLETKTPESEADKFSVLTKLREASHYLQDINYREHPDQVLMAVDVKTKNKDQTFEGSGAV